MSFSVKLLYLYRIEWIQWKTFSQITSDRLFWLLWKIINTMVVVVHLCSRNLIMRFLNYQPRSKNPITGPIGSLHPTQFRQESGSQNSHRFRRIKPIFSKFNFMSIRLVLYDDLGTYRLRLSVLIGSTIGSDGIQTAGTVENSETRISIGI